MKYRATALTVFIWTGFFAALSQADGPRPLQLADILAWKRIQPRGFERYVHKPEPAAYVAGRPFGRAAARHGNEPAGSRSGARQNDRQRSAAEVEYEEAESSSRRSQPDEATSARRAEATVSRNLTIVICLLLAAATVAIYAQTAAHGYLAYDDDQYVYENHWVKAGLTASNIAWAFTTFFYANWHPLTWLSYLLEFSLWVRTPALSTL